jgi:OmpA-OmpF porin, OOP family
MQSPISRRSASLINCKKWQQHNETGPYKIIEITEVCKMKKMLTLGVSLLAATLWSQAALAQDSALSGMDVGQLRPEVQRRYDAALAATQSPEYLASLDSRHMWASEAKAWCGISIGFLKSGIRDEESLSRCERFHAMMERPTPPPAIVIPQPPAPIVSQACDTPLAATIFFEWDSSMLPGNIDETLAFARDNMSGCRWNRFSIVGHADRSGSDSYNDPLSMRRAQAVAARLQTLGVAPSAVSVSAKGETEPKVSTPDGERNPTNRRVEVTGTN